MKIETLYNKGDKITFTKKINEGEYITCPFCKGEQYITVEGVEIHCETCEDGDYYLYKTEEKILDGIIDGISIRVLNSRTDIEYYTSKYGWVKQENIIK